jgi:hypothetical protein
VLGDLATILSEAELNALRVLHGDLATHEAPEGTMSTQRHHINQMTLLAARRIQQAKNTKMFLDAKQWRDSRREQWIAQPHQRS